MRQLLATGIRSRGWGSSGSLSKRRLSARAIPRRGRKRTVEIDRLSASDGLTKGNQQVDPASQDACEGRFGVGWSQSGATNQEASCIIVSWDRATGSKNPSISPALAAFIEAPASWSQIGAVN
jgi:hypothetical protein